MEPATISALIAAGVGLGASTICEIVKWLLDRRKYESERRANLKKEIYFPVIEAISEMKSLIPKIPLTPMDKIYSVTISPEASKALAKLQVASSNEVTEKALAVGKMFYDSITSLIIKKTQIACIENNIKDNEKSIDDSIKSRQLITEYSYIKHKTDHTPIPELIIDIQSVKELDLKLQSLYSENERLIQNKTNAIKSIHQESFDCILKMIAPHSEVIIAIRKDLGLPVDEEKIKKLMQDQTVLISSAVSQFQDDVWRIFDENETNNETGVD